MTRSRQFSNLVFVHRKRTGEVEIRRADGFSRPKAPRTPVPIHLHYTSHDLSNFCRCPNPSRHRFSPAVAFDSTHLAASLTRYLDQHDLEASCTAHFHAFNQQRRDTWAHQGIRIANFHYATRQKDVVCRCTKPNNHGQGTVRNHDIVELCAAYFLRNKTKMTCTKAQWRVVCGEAKSPDNDSFKYDSREVQQLLHTSEQVNCRLPSSRSDMDYFYAGLNGDADIPEHVWEHARPSVWNGRRGSETSCSTPLGTTAAPVDGAYHVSQRRRQSAPLEQSRRSSVATVWSAIQRDAAGDAPEFARNLPRTPLILPRGDRSDVFSFRKPSLPDEMFDKAPESPTYCSGKHLDRIAQPGLETASSGTYPTELPVNRRIPAELPHAVALAELPTEYVHSTHSRELEETGNHADYYDRPGKHISCGINMSNLHMKQVPVNTPSVSRQGHDAKRYLTGECVSHATSLHATRLIHRH
jgi:hypothetical protein